MHVKNTLMAVMKDEVEKPVIHKVRLAQLYGRPGCSTPNPPFHPHIPNPPPQPAPIRVLLHHHRSSSSPGCRKPPACAAAAAPAAPPRLYLWPQLWQR